MSELDQERELRIVLDGAATAAYEMMVSRLKEAVSTIKVQPSHFVSFLLVDFMEAHFEKDMAVLIAEFFDSDAFYEAERKHAKGKSNYEELMADALERARKIKAKRRRKPVSRKMQSPKKSEALTP